ncbi:MAG: hypothetical protein V4631_16150 [Pseudomonadota bacterium]
MDWLLGQFGSTKAVAIAAYCKFVAEGIGVDSPLKNTVHQMLLGDDEFVGRHQSFSEAAVLRDVPKAQRRTFALSLEEYRALSASDDEAMAMAYYSTAFTMLQIAEHFGVSARSVSRAIKKREN